MERQSERYRSNELDLIPFLQCKRCLKSLKEIEEKDGAQKAWFNVEGKNRNSKRRGSTDKIFLCYRVEDDFNHNKNTYPHLFVTINNQTIREPLECNKPMDITTVAYKVYDNELRVSWNTRARRLFSINIYTGHLATVESLLKSVVSRNKKCVLRSRCQPKRKTGTRLSTDVVSFKQVISLCCPISTSRIKIPCKSVDCDHIQCFDASSYLTLNEKNPSWTCPVCKKQALFRTLYVDMYLKEILEKTDVDCVSVTISRDGTWTQTEKTDSGGKKSRDIVIIDLTGDDDDNEKEKEGAEDAHIRNSKANSTSPPSKKVRSNESLRCSKSFPSSRTTVASRHNYQLRGNRPNSRRYPSRADPVYHWNYNPRLQQGFTDGHYHPNYPTSWQSSTNQSQAWRNGYPFQPLFDNINQAIFHFGYSGLNQFFRS